MLTLLDINELTNSKDGDIYSDCYKDVYGHRPRGHTFESLEDFDRSFERLCSELHEQAEQDKLEKEANMAAFQARVADTMILCNCDRERAIMIISDAEGIDEEEFNWYGLESLEYKMGLEFGSLKRWIAE